MRYFSSGLSGRGLLNTRGGLSGRAQALFGGLSLGEKEKGNKMAIKEKTCAERIASEMKDREEYLQGLFDKAEESEYYGDYEEIYELALSVDTKKTTTVCLSWGGPADYLDIVWTEKEGIYTVTYRFEDWFDTAERKVEEGTALWKYAEIVIEGEAN